jgi:hypothetical protein
VLALFGALEWFGFHSSFSAGQHPQPHKGLTFVVLWMILVALGWILTALWFWKRLITEFSYDGKMLQLSTLGVPTTQARHLSEIVEVSEWRGRGGPLGYRIKFRGGAQFFLQYGVSNAAALAEQIGYDLGFLLHRQTATMKRRQIYLAFVIIVAVCTGLLASRYTMRSLRGLPPEITRTEFLSEVAQGHVARVVIADREFISGVSSTRGAFRTRMPVDDAMVKDLRARGVVVEFERGTVGIE